MDEGELRKMRDYRDKGIKGLTNDQLRNLFELEIYTPAQGAPFRVEDNKYEERVLNFGWQCFIRGVAMGMKRQ